MTAQHGDAAQRRLLPLLLLLAAFGMSTAELLAQPKAVLSVLADVETITPGARFRLLLRFTTQPGWHLYWIDPGEAGLPPRVQWSLPAGFQAGPLRFPVPVRHVGPGKTVSHYLPDNPALLVELTAPAELTGTEVELTANADWLICQSQCIQERQKVSIKLPVAAASRASKPANAELFALVAQTMPQTESKIAALQANVTSAHPQPGESFEVVLQLALKDGIAIGTDQSGGPLHHPTELFIEPVAGVSFSPPIFPPPASRKSAKHGDLSEWPGRIFIRVPAVVDPSAPTPVGPIKGVLVFHPIDKNDDKSEPREAMAWSAELGADRQ